MASDYQIGYRKPPAHAQYRKGQSGNPKGRPKGRLNFKTDLEEELREPVQVTEGGRIRVIPKQKAIVKRTMEKALKGELRAIELIYKWQNQYLENAGTDDERERLSPDDRAIIERALGKLTQRKRGTSQDGGAS